MKTLFPGFVDRSIINKKTGYPVDGQKLLSGCGYRDDEDDFLMFIFEFTNGTLDGDSAIVTTTGYSETWKMGKYISSCCLGSVPQKYDDTVDIDLVCEDLIKVLENEEECPDDEYYQFVPDGENIEPSLQEHVLSDEELEAKLREGGV